MIFNISRQQFSFYTVSTNNMQITIKTLTGRKQVFNFEDTDTVQDVKRQLQEKEGIQENQIRLIYSGKQLEDKNTLKSYSIVAGGTIHVSTCYNIV